VLVVRSEGLASHAGCLIQQEDSPQHLLDKAGIDIGFLYPTAQVTEVFQAEDRRLVKPSEHFICVQWSGSGAGVTLLKSESSRLHSVKHHGGLLKK
jgi:hypothetical protein